MFITPSLKKSLIVEHLQGNYLKGAFSRSYCCYGNLLCHENNTKVFSSNWRLIEICENLVLSKIDITMTTMINKMEIDKSRILRNLDPLLKIQH